MITKFENFLNNQGDETFSYPDFVYDYEKKNHPPKKPTANMFSGKGGFYTGGGSEKQMKGVNTVYIKKMRDHYKKITDAYINHFYSELDKGKTPSINDIKSFTSTLHEEGRTDDAEKLLIRFGFVKKDNDKWDLPSDESIKESFLNEEVVGTPLRKYLEKNSLIHDNLIGKRVITKEGVEWYIKEIPPIENTKLPSQIYCTQKPDWDHGRHIKTIDLFVPDDVDIIRESSEDQIVAKEIYNQLGGRRFIVMTGAKNFVSDKYSLQFRIPRAKDGINFVKITLNSMDLYDIEYGKIHGYNYTIVKEEKNVYNDMLVKSFETNTATYTKF